MREKTEVVSFRATSDLLRSIDQERKPFGLSRGDWVRATIVAKIHRHDLTQLTNELVDIRQSVDEVLIACRTSHADLSRVLFTLLTLVGQVSAEEAKSVVRRVFDSISPNVPGGEASHGR